jgi:hypothetical protein
MEDKQKAEIFAALAEHYGSVVEKEHQQLRAVALLSESVQAARAYFGNYRKDQTFPPERPKEEGVDLDAWQIRKHIDGIESTMGSYGFTIAATIEAGTRVTYYTENGCDTITLEQTAKAEVCDIAFLSDNDAVSYGKEKDAAEVRHAFPRGADFLVMCLLPTEGHDEKRIVLIGVQDLPRIQFYQKMTDVPGAAAEEDLSQS